MIKMPLLLKMLFVSILLITKPALAQFKVIGYYPMYAGGYPGGVNSIDLGKITHLNLAFANPDANGNVIPDYGTTANITTVVNACHASGVKVFLSLGGGGASGANYQTLLNNATGRNTFVTKIVAFATTYNLDGIDVDIEGNILDGATLTAAQYQSFVTALGTALHANNLVMSSALGSWFGNFVTNTAAAQFDWINMMSYDLYGPWTGAGSHAPYSMTTSDFQYWNTTKGVPASKLVVGLPFYGYGWGTYANQGIRYCTIVNTYPGSQNNDQIGSGANQISYNGITTIKQKTTYASQNAAGVMIWELTQDCATSDSRSLLLAVSQVLAPLPLTWVDFNATRNEQHVVLSWSTAHEKDNNYFIIERSIDGMSFSEIARINAHENSSSLNEYSYLDTHTPNDRLYYRIKQIDVDGGFSYTSIKVVEPALLNSVLIEVNPSPAVHGEINVHFNHAFSNCRLTLVDMLGHTIYNENILNTESNKQLNIAGITSGIYILSAVEERRVYSIKILVE